METDIFNYDQNIGETPADPILEVGNKFSKQKLLVLISGLVFLLIVLVITAYYLGTQKSITTTQPDTDNRQQAEQPPQSPTPEVKEEPDSHVPKRASFMRAGEIWLKNFETGEEYKISNATRVESPLLSVDGKYVVYYSIVHASGGLPISNFYLSDTQGSRETLLGLTNKVAGRVTWSKDNNYLGYILFSDEQASKVVLYDAENNRPIIETKINSLAGNESNSPVLIKNQHYDTDLECASLEEEYRLFCLEYEQVLTSGTESHSISYKSDQYNGPEYTKPNYHLVRSEKLDNGLVVLEYYTGEPQNPESEWGVGGGVFVPGYDAGVTQTYTLLIDETSGDILEEIPLAINSDFLFI